MSAEICVNDLGGALRARDMRVLAWEMSPNNGAAVVMLGCRGVQVTAQGATDGEAFAEAVARLERAMAAVERSTS